MERNRKLLLGKIAAVMGAIPLLIWAHAAGPDPGKSGVPGESTCNQSQCHVGTALNGGGSVKVAFPNGTNYVPGVKQHLVVTISDPAQRVWGFQLAARQTDNKTQAGTFTSTDGFTSVICASSPTDLSYIFLDFGTNQVCSSAKPYTYIEHTLAGASRVQSGSGTYEFDWTPPATDVGNILVYVAGNAANGDAHPSGDHIYTASYTLTPSAGGSTPTITPGGVVSAGAFGAFTSAAPATWIEIYGANLASTTRGWAASDFSGNNAPTTLENVKVTVGGQLAFVDYVSPGQVNVQIPSNVGTGTQPLVVSNGTASSAAYNLTIDALQPGLLAPPSFSIGGKQHVVAQHQDGTFVLPPNSIAGLNTRQAKPGETIVLYGIGFGPVLTSSNTNIPAGQIVTQANTLANPFAIQIGGAVANVSYDGLAPNFVGLYQFNITTPVIPNNDAAPVTFTLNGAKGAQTLYLAVHD